MTNYLGYGSPEALEAALKADQDESFTIYAEGLVYASVCSSLGPEDTARRMAAHVCGTEHGWEISEDKTFASGEPNPHPCKQKPTTHKHYLFNC